MAYHNDAYYEVPPRDQRFRDNLSILIHFKPKRGFYFFCEMYSVVNGKGVEKFAVNMNWNMPIHISSNTEMKLTSILHSLTIKWKNIL